MGCGMASFYGYRPLNTTEREIRLLTITSKTSSCVFHTQITHVSLYVNMQPTYVALSYTWQKPFEAPSH
ncbi:hypothetical protein F5Y06DRAFT_271947 [Hypoxylon sp. FL0890]|nr:hypothetical protein F5Y06DRAFT_271947 [Hypoxylon sp. FL0890]